jgi:hypothetical protein
MYRISRFAILILLLPSCAPLSPPGFYFVGFDAPTEQLMRMAAKDLSALVTIDRPVTVMAVHGGRGATTEGGRACVGCKDCWVEINVDSSTGNYNMLSGTLFHEFGHCVGLEHLPVGIPGVMNPYMHGYYSWTQDEVTSYTDLIKFVEKEDL